MTDQSRVREVPADLNMYLFKSNLPQNVHAEAFKLATDRGR